MPWDFWIHLRIAASSPNLPARSTVEIFEQQAIVCRNCRESNEMGSRSRWGSGRSRCFFGGLHCEKGLRGGVGASRNIYRYHVNMIYRVMSLHQPTLSICCVSGRINTTEIITFSQIHIFNIVCILCSLGLVVMLFTDYGILNL